MPDALQPLDRLFAEQMAALGHQPLDGVVFEGRVISTGEGVKVGEREAAPRRVEDGQSSDAVGRVEERASEGGEVENFDAFVEWGDLDGAVGNASVGFVVEGGYDLGEMAAVADEDGDLPRLGAARGQWLRKPLPRDPAYLACIAARLPLAKLRWSEIGVRRPNLDRSCVPVEPRSVGRRRQNRFGVGVGKGFGERNRAGRCWRNLR